MGPGMRRVGWGACEDILDDLRDCWCMGEDATEDNDGSEEVAGVEAIILALEG